MQTATISGCSPVVATFIGSAAAAATLVARLDDAVGTVVGTHRGAVWVGGHRARLWRLDGETLAEVTTFQSAPTHDEWHTPWGGPPDVFSIASDGTNLYVSVHVGGILRTTDGSDWTPTIDLHDDVHQVAVGDDGTVWAATGMRGLAESRDQGATWHYHTSGLHARYALAVAALPHGALVAVSSGHAAKDGGVYLFDGERITRCEGLPADLGGAVGPRQLATSGDRAAVALPNGDVYVSDDGGARMGAAGDGCPLRRRGHLRLLSATPSDFRPYGPVCVALRARREDGHGGQTGDSHGRRRPGRLQAITRDLRNRYGAEYQIARASSGADALTVLGEFATARPAGRPDRIRPADARDDRRRVPRSWRRSTPPTPSSCCSPRTPTPTWRSRRSTTSGSTTTCSSRGTRPRSGCTRCSTIC